MIDLKSKHIIWGWMFIAIFMTLGLILEGLHSFKVAWYLDPEFQIRRLMWNLAHAHGTLMGLLHFGFALTLSSEMINDSNKQKFTELSKVLRASSALFALGFFLAGFGSTETDPGIAVILVPISAIALIYVAVRVSKIYVDKKL